MEEVSNLCYCGKWIIVIVGDLNYNIHFFFFTVL
jgi:hypothetical protein